MSNSNLLSDHLKAKAPEDFFCGVVEGFYGRPWTLDQRKDLFTKLKRFGLNTYLYAPKDDLKHRTCWRDLYTVDEAEQLATLINSAKENGILFIYSISPGLDIGYSNPKEISTLKKKLVQIRDIGCSAFSILFDDIEPELSESDKEVFKSFASAHVSVTNEVYQHLGTKHFLFCPTEYCASRAVPNVQNSNYLTTIGDKLLPGIDIMWTGSKVISQNITLDQMQEISQVLKRNPVIWDNLHANDYDQKRLFLGPYSGRSTKLIPYLRGVLTNPNCEYESNFIPIYTLAQWSKSYKDANENTDAKLESEAGDKSSKNISELDSGTYHPKNALRIAIEEWVCEFGKEKGPPEKPMFSQLCTTTTNVIESINSTGFASKIISTCVETPEKKEEIIKETIDGILMSSVADIDRVRIESSSDETVLKETNLNLEPMEADPSPDESIKVQTNLDVLMVEKDDNTVKSMTSVDSSSSSDEMQTEIMSDLDDESKSNMLNYDDVALLVDLFYLPFEHGPKGIQILQEFHWLKTNGHIVSQHRQKPTTETVSNSSVNEWYERASKFNEMTLFIGKLLTRLTFCKNRSLLYEIYAYIWDTKGIISLLNSYVKWIALGRIPMTSFFQQSLGFIPPAFTWFNKGYREAFQSGEQEPWLFRGGLTGEMQRLLPVESVSDLFLYKAPESPSSRIYTIRPYLPADQTLVYDVCFSNFHQSNYLENQQTLVGDRYIGGFLNLSPEYCFIVEDNIGLCGYALAVLDAKDYFQKLEMSWVPELLTKYPMSANSDDNSQEAKYFNEFVGKLHNDCKSMLRDPEHLFTTYPSNLNLSLMSSILDLSVPKRMLACVIAALKANGVYSRIPYQNKKMLDFYLKLGFQVIKLTNENENDDTYVGRII